MAKEKKEYVSYSERILKEQEEIREKIQKERASKKEVKLSMNDQEFRYASALARLSSNDDFKIFLEMENFEISVRMARAFDEHPDMYGKTFGELMAFNKGRYKQAVSFRASRINLLNRYINKMEKENNNG